jgi:hypothetical protein
MKKDPRKEMASVTYSQRTERATSQPWQSNERTELPMRRSHTFPILIFCIILGAGIALAYSMHGLAAIILGTLAYVLVGPLGQRPVGNAAKKDAEAQEEQS